MLQVSELPQFMVDSPGQFFEFHKGHLLLHILVKPKSSRDELIGIYQDRLKVALKAPPVDQQANQELIGFFSKLLKQPKSRISLIRGMKSTRKTLEIRVEGADHLLAELLQLMNAGV